jgi:hypothetical protein
MALTKATFSMIAGAPVNVDDYIPAGTDTATTDCSAFINAALTAGSGKTIVFGQSQTYRANSTLTIKGNGTKILGRNATIDSYATVSALTCELTGGTTYLVNIDIEDFAIISRGVGAYAFRVLTSYSTYRRVSIGLPVVNANGRGFFLPGDEANGTGPYYNTFIDCDVQSSSAGADHIGVSFSAIAPLYRTPNANTWIGGRVGQCLKNFVIKGNGNSFTNPASENAALTGTAFLFEADSATNCQQNYIHSCYIESANKGIEFTSAAKDNYVFGVFITGVTTAITDAGTGNSVISAIAAWKMPMGASFPTPSASATALDAYLESAWTPVATNLTVVGTPTYTGIYTKIGNRIFWSLDVISTTSTAATANSTYFSGLPVGAGNGDVAPAVRSDVTSLGNGLLDTANGRVYAPTWSATALRVFLSGSYQAA